MFALIAAIGGAIGAAWLWSLRSAHDHSASGLAIRLFVSITVAVINTRPAVDLVNRMGWSTISEHDVEYIALIGSLLGFFAHSMVGILDVTRARFRGRDVFEVLAALRQKRLKSTDKEQS